MSTKVLNVRTSLGGLHGKTSYDAEKDKADMELTALGVKVKTLNGKPLVLKNGKQFHILLPYPNCSEVQVEVDEDKAETEEVKRGPGRPPGPRAA